MTSKKVSNKKFKHVYIFAFLFSLALMVASIRWQIVEASKFEEIQKARTYSSEIDSLRGPIYARDGSTLAHSEPRFDVFVWMQDILFFENKGLQTREQFVSTVAPVIDTTEEELEEVIEANYEEQGITWFKIADNISSEQWETLNNARVGEHSFNLRGLAFEYTSNRNYPEGQLASHVLGLTTMYEDTVIGEGGVEGYWDGILNPIKGYRIQEDNAFGEAIPTALLPTVEPKNGSQVYTSIDKRLQQIAEEKIAWGIDTYDATSGTIIIVDPVTGEILALANAPTYDPNIRESETESYANIAISSPFETGSTGKVLTIAAAIDLGEITPDSIILENGHQGCEEIHRDLLPVCTWNKQPQPPMPASECFALSDNLCFYHMAELMAKSDFYDYLRAFGAGSPSGVDMEGESYGFLKDFERWNTGDVSAFSYGHGYQLNALQALMAVATIANDGVRMKPHVVNKVVDSNGEIKEFQPEMIEEVVSSQTADQVKAMMHDIYQRNITPGEFYYDDLRNYPIGIKSGTALIANETGYTNDINATYIGFDASDEKTFAMIVTLNDPKIPSYDRLSFYNARLVWLETFDAIKDHLDVPTK